jgi:hypothetical protein
MSDLKSQLIKLGYSNPELREHIRPVLDRMAYQNGNYGDQSKNRSFYPNDSVHISNEVHGEGLELQKQASKTEIVDRLIKMGEEKPELREHIRPVLDRIV